MGVQEKGWQRWWQGGQGPVQRRAQLQESGARVSRRVCGWVVLRGGLSLGGVVRLRCEDRWRVSRTASTCGRVRDCGRARGRAHGLGAVRGVPAGRSRPASARSRRQYGGCGCLELQLAAAVPKARMQHLVARVDALQGGKEGGSGQAGGQLLMCTGGRQQFQRRHGARVSRRQRRCTAVAIQGLAFILARAPCPGSPPHLAAGGVHAVAPGLAARAAQRLAPVAHGAVAVEVQAGLGHALHVGAGERERSRQPGITLAGQGAAGLRRGASSPTPPVTAVPGRLLAATLAALAPSSSTPCPACPAHLAIAAQLEAGPAGGAGLGAVPVAALAVGVLVQARVLRVVANGFADPLSTWVHTGGGVMGAAAAGRAPSWHRCKPSPPPPRSCLLARHLARGWRRNVGVHIRLDDALGVTDVLAPQFDHSLHTVCSTQTLTHAQTVRRSQHTPLHAQPACSRNGPGTQL